MVRGKIKRVVRINLVALRALQACKDGKPDSEETKKLQEYILGLALVAVTQPVELSLREGCLLCRTESPTIKGVYADGAEADFNLDSADAANFAESAARHFFGEAYENKDRLNARFESEVANEFLAMSREDRKKIARNGPITADAIRRFKDKGKDPFKPVLETLKTARKNLPKKRSGSNTAPGVSEPFKEISERLEALAQDEQIDEREKELVEKLKQLVADNKDTRATIKALEDQIKAFNRQHESNQTTETEEPNLS